MWAKGSLPGAPQDKFQISIQVLYLFIYLFIFCLIPVDFCFSNSIDFDCFLAGVVTEIECFTCRVYRAAAAALPALNRLRCASVRPAPKK